MKLRFEEELRRNGKLVCTCTGTSMLPMLRQHRDLLVIEPPPGRLKRYDVPLYRRDSGEYILHRVLRVRRDGYVICGDHQWRRETGVADRQVLGVLTAFVRDGREIPVTDWRYRLYAHLWCDFFWIRAAILKFKHCAERRSRRRRRKRRGHR